MAFDEVTVRQVLGLLDRQSSKTLNHAVLQFKVHKQRFHESLIELKSLKLPSGEGVLSGFVHSPLKPGGEFSNGTGHPSFQSLQATCTPSKPVVNSSVIQEDIENYGSKQYTLQSQANCTPLKPPVDSTVVQAGVENYGSKQYTLRSRAPKKLSTTVVPQRITRSRAKQPVATGTAAACNILPKTELMVLEDDFVKVRNKIDRKPQGGFFTEAALSDFEKAHPNQDAGGHESRLQGMPAGTNLSSQKQPISCEEKPINPSSINTFKNLEKERSGLKDRRSVLSPTEQFRLLSPQSSRHKLLSKSSLSATPYHSIANCDLQVCGEAPKLDVSGGWSSRARLINGCVTNLPKSPTICIPSPIPAKQGLSEANDASHCKGKHEKQASTIGKDGSFVTSTKNCDAFEFCVSKSIQNQSPHLMTEGFHRHSPSHKRKLSACGVSANDQRAAKKRISMSYNSPLYEVFNFEETPLDMATNTRKEVMKSSPLHGQERATFHEKLNTSRSKDFVEQREGSHESNGMAQPGLASGKVSEGPGESLMQALYEVVGSREIPQRSSSKGMECLFSGVDDEKPALPEPAEVTTEVVPAICEVTRESFIPTHKVEPHCEDQPKALEDQGSFVSELEHSNRVSLQVEQDDASSSHNEGITPLKSMQVMVPCLHEHVEEKFTLGSRSKEFNHDIEPEDIHTQPNACEALGNLVFSADNNQVTSAGSSPARLQFEQIGRGSLFQADSPQAMSEAVESIPCEHAEEILTKNSNLAYYSAEALALENPAAVIDEEGECMIEAKISFGFVPSKDCFDCCQAVEKISSPSPNMLPRNEETSSAKMAELIPPVEEMYQVKVIESCGQEVKLEMPCTCSHDAESEGLWIPKLYQTSPLRSNSLGRPSPSAVKKELSMQSSKCIPDVETNLGITDGGDHSSDSESQMDCSESPRPCHAKEEDEADEGIQRDNESIKEWTATPTGDEVSLNFNQLLAQGTVNSSRRKRARSPMICSDESCKDLKRMKSMSNDEDEQFEDRGLPPLYSQRPSFGRSSSSTYGFPYFSPLRRFPDALTFEDSPRKSHDFSDFHGSLQRQMMMGSDKLSKSYSRLPPLPKDYKDTPHFRSVRAGFVDRVGLKLKKQKSECHGITHIKEHLKENQSPEILNRGKSYSNTSIMDGQHVVVNTRRVLGHANRSLQQVESPHGRYDFATGTGSLAADRMRVMGNSNHSLEERVESPHKRYNLATGTGSFLDLMQPKQVPLPYANGKREVRVKALEAAELARKQEEKRENERKLRRMDCNDGKGADLEWAQDKCAPNIAGRGVTNKVKRAAELKMKMDQAKARKQEVEQRRKEEERKKKEAELADRKRKREDADKRDREEKRKRVEEVQRLRKEQEERQRVELNEKELKWKMLEERERERKAQEEDAKRQRRLEKEKEAERRRKQDQDLKVARFAEKLADRKRKEAVVHVPGGNEDDDLIAQIALGNKLSFLSTDSFALSASNDWDTHSTNMLRTRSQTSGGLRVPSVGISAYGQNNDVFLGEKGAFHSTKQVVTGLGSMCEPFKSLSYITPSNTSAGLYAPAQLMDPGNEIQSYEISPYKSSSDDEDDDRPKKPVPLWAKKENLLQQLLSQQRVNPDRIFSSEKTCRLAEIFGTTGSRRCRDFKQRSASGDWLDDHATWKEEHDYKKAMGYL